MYVNKGSRYSKNEGSQRANKSVGRACSEDYWMKTGRGQGRDLVAVSSGYYRQCQWSKRNCSERGTCRIARIGQLSIKGGVKEGVAEENKLHLVKKKPNRLDPVPETDQQRNMGEKDGGEPSPTALWPFKLFVHWEAEGRRDKSA